MAIGGVRELPAEHFVTKQKQKSIATRPLLGDLLQWRGDVSAADIATSLMAQHVSRARLGDILTSRDMTSRRSVAAAVAYQRGLPFVDLNTETNVLPAKATLENLS